MIDAVNDKLVFTFLLKRIKRGDNRDKRVELLQLFARTHFPSVKYMEYAVQVETYTLSKANNLVLNVDGAIGSLFLDLLAGSGMFTKQEIDEIVQIGYLNGLFVLARSIGLIGWVGLHFWFPCLSSTFSSSHSPSILTLKTWITSSYSTTNAFGSSDQFLVNSKLQAHLRPEEIEAAPIPSPMGGCPLHQVRSLWISDNGYLLRRSIFPPFYEEFMSNLLEWLFCC